MYIVYSYLSLCAWSGFTCTSWTDCTIFSWLFVVMGKVVPGDKDLWGQPIWTMTMLPNCNSLNLSVTLEIQHCTSKDEATFSLLKFVLTKITIFGVSIIIHHIKEANVLLSAVQEKMKTDPSAFDTFIKILRLEQAYSIKKLWLKCQAYQESITIRNL